MENKQSSVDWLLDQYIKVGGITKSMFAKAKEMEREQLKSCYEHGSTSIIEMGHGDTFDEYYSERFKSNIV